MVLNKWWGHLFKGWHHHTSHLVDGRRRGKFFDRKGAQTEVILGLRNLQHGVAALVDVSLSVLRQRRQLGPPRGGYPEDTPGRTNDGRGHHRGHKHLEVGIYVGRWEEKEGRKQG